MSNINDTRIMELKQQIEKKKKELGVRARFAPITNCSIELDGFRYNIQTLDKDSLIMVMLKLNLYAMSAENLKLKEEVKISGFSIGDWINDIESRLDIISNKEEENKLKTMENKLVKLLSEGKKVELEIDEIENILKNK